MSGIRNIKKLAKKYKQAEIYFHIDLDGVTSALAMKEYLNSYGIKVVAAHKLNYGSDEYNISAPEEGNMGVMVDFSHGKPFIQIHTDHHQSQIVYNDASVHFRHSKSNASTISSIIGNGIFSSDDEKAIDMIDSASFVEYNINPKEVGNAVFKCDKNKDNFKRHLEMALACNKLLLTYKNRNAWLTNLVMNCKPSLESIYNQLLKWTIDNHSEDYRIYKLPTEINENVEKYFEDQKNKSKVSLNCEDINTLKNGQSILIGDCIVQVGGGYMKRIGSYERYTAFRIFPQAKYFIMIWDEIGMMQVSRNPWNLTVNDNVDLGKIVLHDMFLNQFSKTQWLNNKSVSLLALKSEFERNIEDEKEKYCIGFNILDFESIFKNCRTEFDVDPENKISRSMSLRMSKYWCENMNPARAEQSMRMIRFMNNQRVSLIDVIKTMSGGHKAITNLTGFNMLNRQLQIDASLSKNDNPFRPLTEEEREEIKEKKNGEDTYVLKLLKTFAKEVVQKLNAPV